VSFALPSELAELRVRGEIEGEETTSWADVEKDTSAWLGNDMQKSAFTAIQKAEPYSRRDGTNKKMWRLMQTSDHFYYMATKHGSSGEVHSYFSQSEPFSAFKNYMTALSSYENCCIPRMKNKKAAKILRTLKPEEAFHFYEGQKYLTSAHSLVEFAQKLRKVSDACVMEHHGRRDFEKWISDTVGDRELSTAVSSVKPEGCVREKLTRLVEERVSKLWSLLK